MSCSRLIRAAVVALVLALALRPLPVVAQRNSEPARETTLAEFSQTFRDVIHKIKPSVVSIRAIKHAQPAEQSQSAERQVAKLRELFGADFAERFSQAHPQGDLELSNVGSGMIVRGDGYVLTSGHIVKRMDEILVRVSGEKKPYPARLVGVDEATDLAVLKIEARGLTPVRFGDSENLVVGDWVVAVGHPFGLQHTATVGIVSGQGRARVGLSAIEDYIQTDAAINPGSSGGPLVNLQGEVVGLNTAIASRSGGWTGIGFAIPMKLARAVMDTLIEEGRVLRGGMEIAVTNLTEELSRSLGIEEGLGVLVAAVRPGGLAEKGGLRQGDVIRRFNDEDVHDALHLRSLVASTRPGSEAKLDVQRKGERRTLGVEMVDAAQSVPQPQADDEGKS